MMLASEATASYQRTEAGILPGEWRCVSILDVARLESGHTPSRRSPSYWGGDIPWVSLHDTKALGHREISETARTITNEGLNNSSARLLPKGTVVFSRTATVGKATVLAAPMATSQDFANYICGEDLHNHFLVYLFRSMGQTWQRLMAGSIHNTIYMPVFKALKIALPPLAEQIAIAGALNDLDVSISQIDRLLAKKRDLKQAAMEELLTSKIRLPGFSGKWERIKVGELLTFKNGLNKAKEFFGYGTPIVNYMDVFSSGRILSSQLAGRVSLSNQELSTFDVRKGDVLFTRTSETPEEIGMASVVLDEPRQTVFSGFVLRGRPLSNRLSDGFKAYCFRSSFVRSQIIAKASYTTRALTNGRLLSAVVLPVPTLPEQEAIAGVLTAMDEEIASLEVRRVKAHALKQAMMQELLTGRIRLV